MNRRKPCQHRRRLKSGRRILVKGPVRKHKRKRLDKIKTTVEEDMVTAEMLSRWKGNDWSTPEERKVLEEEKKVSGNKQHWDKLRSGASASARYYDSVFENRRWMQDKLPASIKINRF